MNDTIWIFAAKKLRNDAFENLPRERKLGGLAEAKGGLSRM